MRKFWKWLRGPWTRGQYNEEQSIVGDAAARGATTAPATQWALERLRRRWFRLRVFGTIVVLVSVAAFLTVFTSNRFVHGVSVAATASAAPVALFLGLRRD